MDVLQNQNVPRRGRITTIPEPYRSYFVGRQSVSGYWVSANPDFWLRVVVSLIWVPVLLVPSVCVALMGVLLLLQPIAVLQALFASMAATTVGQRLVMMLITLVFVLVLASLAYYMSVVSIGLSLSLYRSWRAAYRGDRYGLLLTSQGIAARCLDLYKSDLDSLNNCFWLPLESISEVNSAQQWEAQTKGPNILVHYVVIVYDTGTLKLQQEHYPMIGPTLERWWQHRPKQVKDFAD